MIRRALCIALLGAGPLALATGCISASISDSISGSSESLSKSSKSLSDSVSNSSQSLSGGDAEASAAAKLYQEDVRALAHIAADAGTQPATFRAELGRLSEAHGVTHWQARADAWRAIDAGLAEGGLAPEEADAFRRAIDAQEARALSLTQVVEAGR